MKKTKVNHAFLLTLDTLEEFYTRCRDENALTEPERTKILVELMSEKKAEYLGATDKTAPELATEMIKQGIKARSYTKGQPKS